MTEPTIRQARPEDVDTIIEIALRAWEPIFTERREVMGEDIAAREIGDARRRKADNIRGHCEWDFSTVYVTEIDGRIAGFITFAPFP